MLTTTNVASTSNTLESQGTDERKHQMIRNSPDKIDHKSNEDNNILKTLQENGEKQNEEKRKQSETKNPIRDSPLPENVAVAPKPVGNHFNIVTLNVGGMRYQTRLSTLKKYPKTLLGDTLRRAPYYNDVNKEYFFDRHRLAFESILYYYQSPGVLTKPDYISMETFLSEIKFFDLGPDAIRLFLKNEGMKFEDKNLEIPRNKVAKMIWDFFEYPDSSVFARILAAFSMITILISVISFVAETTTLFEDKCVENSPKLNWKCPFFCVEFACILWFTIEFLLRFIFCPDKMAFCKKCLNIVDLLAIFPFYVKFFLSKSDVSFAILRILRILRIFRVFKAGRYSEGLQILGETLKASVQELFHYVFFLTIAGVLFASGMYYAEQYVDDTDFTSIPSSLWYTVVSMTTVGYGDVVPETLIGRLLGSVCIIGGVIIMSMPVVVVVDNFQFFYAQRARLSEISDLVETDGHFELQRQQDP